MLKEHADALKNIFKITDILLVLGSAVFSYYLKFNTLNLDPKYIIVILLICIISFFIFNTFKLYKPWRGISLVDELTAVSYSHAISSMLILVIFFLFKISFSFSREWFLSYFVISFILLIASRILLRYSLSYARCLGFNMRQICLVILNDNSVETYKQMSKLRDLGLEVVAVFTDDMERNRGDIPVTGHIDNLNSWLRENTVDQLWIISPLSKEHAISKIIDSVKNLPLSIRYLPDLTGFNLINHSVSEIDGMMIVNVQEPPINNISKWILKRGEDIIFSLLILIIISPLLFIIYLIIKLTSKGPVLYKQVRLSYNNKPFYIYKFRTMPVGVEKDSGAVWAKPGEMRATRFGSLLRKSSLDELPQFFNVLKGNMSIVGPRPERPKFVKEFKKEIPNYMKKHMVKAGITGWAQVNGWRGNTDIYKRVEYDLYYIKNWSIGFDLKIILLTIFRIFKDTNAY